MTLCRVRPEGSNITGNVLLCKAMGINPFMRFIQPWQDSTSVTTGQFHSLEEILDVSYASSTKNSTGSRKWNNGGRQTFLNYWLMLSECWSQTSTCSAFSLQLVRHKQDIRPPTNMKLGVLWPEGGRTVKDQPHNYLWLHKASHCQSCWPGPPSSSLPPCTPLLTPLTSVSQSVFIHFS